MTTISTPNAASNTWPSTRLPICAPIAAPIAPATAKTVAHGHFTVRARACPPRLASELAATATALVPMATWGGSPK